VEVLNNIPECDNDLSSTPGSKIARRNHGAAPFHLRPGVWSCKLGGLSYETQKASKKTRKYQVKHRCPFNPKEVKAAAKVTDRETV